MKSIDIRELSSEELSKRIAEEKGQLSKMKLNHGISPLENPTKIRIARRVIARLETILNQRKS